MGGVSARLVSYLLGEGGGGKASPVAALGGFCDATCGKLLDSELFVLGGAVHGRHDCVSGVPGRRPPSAQTARSECRAP